MNLPEKLVQDTHNTEEGLTRRLAEYRLLNGEDETVANVFEEEFDLTVIKFGIEVIEEDKSYLHKNIVDLIKVNYMKEPRNYGLTVDEKETLKKTETEERLKREREEKEERERKEAEEAVERVRKQTEWVCIASWPWLGSLDLNSFLRLKQEKLEQIKHEELEYLETQSIPLRNYLMSHVMPTLTKGLIECAKIKPDDPIDYLAEFLFKNNPQIN
jgi:adenylate kinase